MNNNKYDLEVTTLELKVKYKLISFFGCHRQVLTLIKANENQLDIYFYDSDKNKTIINERHFLSINGKQIVSISNYQSRVDTKNSFIIGYIKNENLNCKDIKKSLGELEYIRFYCENKFEVERYYIRLKELYGKKISDYFSENKNSSNDIILNIENIKRNNIYFVNPKNFHHSVKINENLINKIRLTHIMYNFFNRIREINKNKDDENTTENYIISDEKIHINI